MIVSDADCDFCGTGKAKAQKSLNNAIFILQKEPKKSLSYYSFSTILQRSMDIKYRAQKNSCLGQTRRMVASDSEE
jgi:hypothetical protein